MSWIMMAEWAQAPQRQKSEERDKARTHFKWCWALEGGLSVRVRCLVDLMAYTLPALKQHVAPGTEQAFSVGRGRTVYLTHHAGVIHLE